MAFDPRSLERLKQLGRTLPQPLPAAPAPAKQPQRASDQRHRVETETNPEALFRELITVSADGTVPPHLLDRLRLAEQQQQAKPQVDGRAGSLGFQGEGSRGNDAVALMGPSSRSAPSPNENRPRRQANQLQAKRGLARGKALQPVNEEELQLYEDFQDLLHIDPLDVPTPGPKPQPRLDPSDRLKPKPMDRRGRR
jgi:hypothetical protein